MEITQQYKKYIMWATLAGMFALVCLLTTLTPYVTDDYKYFFIYPTGERVDSLGDIVTSMVAHWYSWGGRVMAHTLAQLFLWLPKIIFNVANAGMYVWFVYLIYAFVQPNRKTISLTLLFAILAVLWLWTPIFGETILWLTGSCNYLWGCTLMLAWLSCFKRHLDAPKPHTIWFTIGITLFSFVVGAFNENTSAAALLCAGLFMLYMLYEKIKWQAWMITSLISGFLGWLFLILAPGNSARASSEEVGWSFFAIVYNRLLTAIKMWQVSFVLMLAVFVVLFIVAVHQKVDAKQIHLSVIMLFTAFACNFAMLGTPLYPDRASMGVFVFLVLACGILFQSLQVEWCVLVSQCVVAVIVMLALSDAVVASEAIIQCHSLYQDRTAEILACKAAGDTEVESYTINSTNEKSIYHTLGWADTRLNYQGTSFFAIYYGLDEVDMSYDVYYGEDADE